MEISNEQKLIFADCILASIRRDLESDPSSICFEVYGLGGLIRMFPDYGWVDKTWLRKQQENGDHSWDSLFEKAGQIGRRPYK